MLFKKFVKINFKEQISKFPKKNSQPTSTSSNFDSQCNFLLFKFFPFSHEIFERKKYVKFQDGKIKVSRMKIITNKKLQITKSWKENNTERRRKEIGLQDWQILSFYSRLVSISRDENKKNLSTLPRLLDALELSRTLSTYQHAIQSFCCA